jgi:hypothetical protein
MRNEIKNRGACRNTYSDFGDSYEQQITGSIQKHNGNFGSINSMEISALLIHKFTTLTNYSERPSHSGAYIKVRNSFDV